MAKFLLLLHDSPADYEGLSAEEIQSIIEEYSAWRDRIAGEGRLVGSNKLKDEGGRELSARNGQVRVVDGPYAEAKEVISGYFLIEAADYDEAVEISQKCPHLKYGGRIELREIDPIHD